MQRAIACRMPHVAASSTWLPPDQIPFQFQFQAEVVNWFASHCGAFKDNCNATVLEGVRRCRCVCVCVRDTPATDLQWHAYLLRLKDAAIKLKLLAFMPSFFAIKGLEREEGWERERGPVGKSTICYAREVGGEKGVEEERGAVAALHMLPPLCFPFFCFSGQQ